MKKTEEFLNRWKLKLMAVGVLIALSLVVVLAGFRFYSRYREQVIRTEESQLLTMAGIVGNNLDSYLEQQMDEIDLFYSPWKCRAPAAPSSVPLAISPAS